MEKLDGNGRRRTKLVLAAFRLAYSSNRGFLAGVAHYIRRHPNWRVTVDEDFTDFNDALLAAAAAEFDGIITVRPHTAMAEDAIGRSALPMAILGTGSGDCKTRKRDIVFVRGKDREIGVIAARHFMSLGNFRSYAFVGAVGNVSWSGDRWAGFNAELQRRSRKAVPLHSRFQNGSPGDIEFLATHLASLPKPTAVMAAYDGRAKNVLLACDAAGLEVPHQVSVIGVDNDSVLCDFSKPALTSISINPETKGERAAAELERIMRGRGHPRRTVFVQDATVVERESTAPIAPSSHLVERALRFIGEKACTGIHARDVVAHLGVSRALADRRFRECGIGTIGNAISKVRIEEVKRLLRETQMPIARITANCGFADENYAKRAFRKTTGTTMRAWRSSSRSTPPLSF